MTSSVVKVGTWGAAGGSTHDITVAPQRLESITIRSGKIIDCISFSYRDREKQQHTAGPWGGKGGTDENTITLEPAEYITEVGWSVGSFELEKVESCITSLKVVWFDQRSQTFCEGHSEHLTLNRGAFANGEMVVLSGSPVGGNGEMEVLSGSPVGGRGREQAIVQQRCGSWTLGFA